MSNGFPTTESDWDYDGPFSYSAEFHMSILGFIFGFFFGISKQTREELLKEPVYIASFYMIGIACGYIIERHYNEN